MAFFEIQTASDMLRKARRELSRLESDASIDHVYNFFVTAYHVTDYLEKANSVPSDALRDLRADYLFERCGDVCNKAKHVRLERKRPDITPTIFSGTINGAPINTLPINGGEERWIFWPQDDTYMELVSFARSIVVKLESFFEQHKIPL